MCVSVIVREKEVQAWRVVGVVAADLPMKRSTREWRNDMAPNEGHAHPFSDFPMLLSSNRHGSSLATTDTLRIPTVADRLY